MINLLSFSEKINIKKEYRLRVLTVGSILLALFMIITIVSFIPVYVALDSKYQALTSESKSATALNQRTKASALLGTIETTNMEISKLQKTGVETHSQRILSEILALKTSQISFTGLSYENTVSASDLPAKTMSASPRVTITGTAATRQSLLDFADSLRQKKFFIFVDLPISNLINETNLNYTIKIYVDPNADIIKK